MDVYWLEQNESDVPAENHWLSPGETRCLTAMRFAKRRTDWRLGRWTAKRALAACLQLPADLPALANIEIRAASSGAPEVFLRNQRAPVTISLSHRAGAAICAVALSATSLGCDLETVEPRIATFAADYFTANEQTLVEQTCAQVRPLLVTLLWSAKESALKALNTGLRLDTNSVEVSLLDASLLPADDSPQPNPASTRPAWRPLAGSLLRRPGLLRMVATREPSGPDGRFRRTSASTDFFSRFPKSHPLPSHRSPSACS